MSFGAVLGKVPPHTKFDLLTVCLYYRGILGMGVATPPVKYINLGLYRNLL
jgi:hypothetical protein